ncbi:hypothetical protein [Mucilaginibacter sp. UYCu711]|uniref:hypothetical protein n=1 Tax=Mucilaginibacter sp. UYCu711 TaxID=3156339 RepID=UPI003D23582F
MTAQLKYTIYKDDEGHNITITPLMKTLPNGEINLTGVFKLTEGGVDLGDIVFDNMLKQWEYTAMGYLDHANAAEIAGFIQTENVAITNNNDKT